MLDLLGLMTKNLKRRNILAGAAIFMVITLNLLAYTGRLPLWALGWPYSDKVIHFFAYAGLTLGLSARLSHRRVRIGRTSIPLISLLPALTALGDEGLQSLSPARSLELADLLSNLRWDLQPKAKLHAVDNQPLISIRAKG